MIITVYINCLYTVIDVPYIVRTWLVVDAARMGEYSEQYTPSLKIPAYITCSSAAQHSTWRTASSMRQAARVPGGGGGAGEGKKKGGTCRDMTSGQ